MSDVENREKRTTEELLRLVGLFCYVCNTGKENRVVDVYFFFLKGNKANSLIELEMERINKTCQEALIYKSRFLAC